MTLSLMLDERAAAGQAVRVGLIGAGRFGAQFLAQARRTPGLHVAAVADLDPERGPTALALAQWPPVKAVARSLADALAGGGTWVTMEPLAMFESPGLDVVVDATTLADDGIRHALSAIEHGVHVVMANLAADILAGPVLAQMARERGLVYSLAYGDQPALICELVDWARSCGFEVAAAGRGTRWLPGYELATPETVWKYWGITGERARSADLDARICTAIIDGSRAAMELAAVCNATGLRPPSAGLEVPPCATHDLTHVLKPRQDGGRLEDMGRVELVTSVERDGRAVIGGLGSGVFVTFRSASEYASQCFQDLGSPADGGGYSARWRNHHLGGMELGVSVASAALLGVPTGTPSDFVADVVAVAKDDLAAGTTLDGYGGFTVHGRLLPAAESVRQGFLPLALSHGATLNRAVAAGEVVGWSDVALPASAGPLVDIRRALEDWRRD